MFLSGLLPQVATRLPDAVALKQADVVLRYGDLHDRASRLARAFQDLGLVPGDRVALLGHPGIGLIVAEHAAVAAGAIPFAVYATLAQKEMQQIVDDARPSLLVFDAAMAGHAARMRYDGWRPIEIAVDDAAGDRLDDVGAAAGAGGGASVSDGAGVREAVADGAADAGRVDTLGADAGGADDGRADAAGAHRRPLSLAALIAGAAPLESWSPRALDDVALLVYTGGTSGRPKGVMHTHRSVSSWVNMNHPNGPGYAPEQRTVLFNLAHLSGQAGMWKTIAAGGSIVVLPRYPPTGAEIVDIIERERITNFGAVGGTLSDIVNLPGIEQRDLRSLKVVAAGGSFISPTLMRRAVAVLPSAMVMVVYSLTESGQLVCALPVNDAIKRRPERLRSVGAPGRPMFGQTPFAVRIVDDAGRDVGAGETGEILLRGEQMMAGYWTNTEATAGTLRDGWLHTGDIGRLDAAGDLYLVDRKRDIVIGSNGVNVYTSEVEDVASRHPSIADIAIFGTAGTVGAADTLDSADSADTVDSAANAGSADGAGVDGAEQIAAAAVLRSGTTLTLQDLRDFCAEEIAAFKLPSRLLLVDRLPRTVVGKIDKTRLRQMMLQPA